MNKWLHKNELSKRPSISQRIRDFYRKVSRKKHCKNCGTRLAKIRGRFPNEPRREVCPQCCTEEAEWNYEKRTEVLAENNKNDPAANDEKTK